MTTTKTAIYIESAAIGNAREYAGAAARRIKELEAQVAQLERLCSLAEIARLRAAIATARNDALDAVLARLEDYERGAYQHGNLPYMDPQECAAQAAREIAASIQKMKEQEP